jgi:hypothetical protein
MLGKRLKEKPDRGGRDRLMEILMKMETALKTENFEILPSLLEEFERELDIALKGSFIKTDVLQRYAKVLKHLEEIALSKKAELNRKEEQLKKLKKYGEFT